MRRQEKNRLLVIRNQFLASLAMCNHFLGRSFSWPGLLLSYQVELVPLMSLISWCLIQGGTQYRFLQWGPKGQCWLYWTIKQGKYHVQGWRDAVSTLYKVWAHGTWEPALWRAILFWGRITNTPFSCSSQGLSQLQLSSQRDVEHWKQGSLKSPRRMSAKEPSGTCR